MEKSFESFRFLVTLQGTHSLLTKSIPSRYLLFCCLLILNLVEVVVRYWVELWDLEYGHAE